MTDSKAIIDICFDIKTAVAAYNASPKTRREYDSIIVPMLQDVVKTLRLAPSGDPVLANVPPPPV